MDKIPKSCLVISYGPVPTPEYQTVEGGGMRVWGLAEGLKSHGVDVTVAVNNSFPQKLKAYDGIKLTNWGQDQHFVDLLNSYDSVIASYTMGSDSVFIADHINDSIQLILDAYVPIYVEVSARDSKDIDTEYRNYMEDVKRFNHVLRRGDYFLCASETQKIYYTGVLSSLGIINPRSYREDRIIIAPFGIHDTEAVAAHNPYRKLGIKEDDFVAMWFGGLYPWFRIQELLDAVLIRSKDPNFKFVIVGGKNPFNPNPDFSLQYDKAFDFAKKHSLLDKTMFFVDWVDFSDRINWFKHADVVVSLNQPGEENKFSWRTRVMDFVWGELVILTNGGDALSEDLIADNAALRLKDLSAKTLSDDLALLQHDHEKAAEIRKNIRDLKPRYYWQAITQPIANRIIQGETPNIAERHYRHHLHVSTVSDQLEAPSKLPAPLRKARRLAGLSKRAVSYARHKGLKRSVLLASQIAKGQVQNRLAPKAKQYIFIGHHMDDTGAPIVLMEIIAEYADKYGARNVRLVSSHVAPSHLRKLRELGVKVDKAAMAFGFRLIRAQLNIKKDDFVLINTIAIYPNYRDFILHELTNNNLREAYWFIHEDKAQIPVIDRDFTHKDNVKKISKLLSSKKLHVLTPSARTRDDYKEILQSDSVQAVPLAVSVPSEYCKPRPVSDYTTARLFLSGTPADGRKGQALAIAAVYDFMARYYNSNPQKYRDFTLELLSIGSDYVSQQITWLAQSLLGDHAVLRPSVPRNEALKIAAGNNIVICCSLNETFGLYVAEAMLMGHAVLRNGTAGMEEQLKEGVNGYFIDHHDIHQFSDQMEILLNRKKTTDAAFQAMGEASQDIMAEYMQNTYLEKIENCD
ncbi:MAG TPA: glycosyltransferase [Candidatus Limnocylindrales bacterium]|nr:glycosyltransferase [Candidatus Limnocylindrales bacterium]